MFPYSSRAYSSSRTLIAVILFIMATFIWLLSFYDTISKSEIKTVVRVYSGNRDVSNEVFYQHWPDDNECSKFKTHLGKNLPLTYLASFPRSGNSWTLYLIEAATGIFTSSVYKNRRLKGELIKWNSGRVIVVKIHPHFQSSTVRTLQNHPVIYILRNPYKSIVSYWDFLQSKGKDPMHFVANRTSYKTSEFQKHASISIINWEKSSIEVILMTNKLHVVFYEDLKENPIKELRKILKFLHMRPNEDRLLCTKKHLEGYAKRKHEEVHPYDKALEMELKRAIFNVANALRLRDIDVPKEYKLLIKNQTNYKP